MKQCPECQRTYADDTQIFCQSDGTILSAMPEAAPAPAAIQQEAAVPFPAVPPLPAVPFTPAVPDLPVLPSLPVPSSAPAPSFAPPVPLFPAPGAPASTKVSPVIAGGAVLLVVLMAGMYRFASAKKTDAPPAPVQSPAQPESPQAPGDAPSQPGTAPPAPSSQPAAPPAAGAPINEADLKYAIRYADEAEVQALRTLDPAPLYNAYFSEALQAELKKLQDFKDKGYVVDAHLDSQEFQSFRANQDGSIAEVRLVETWTTNVYSVATKRLVESRPGERTPQIISLIHSEKGWLVEADVPQ